jgi:hypothetical protein
MKDVAEHELAQAIEALADALAQVARPADVAPLGDDGLLAMTTAVEALGRRVDALRVHCAAEIDGRSPRGLGAERLSAKKGCRTPAELIARISRVSEATAVRRRRLGSHIVDRLSLLGERMPARFPSLAAAMASGDLGFDSAQVIAAAFGPIRDRAHPEDWAVAEQQIVADAIGPDGFTADQTRVQASAWQVALDPDGAEQSAEEAMRHRGLTRVGTRDGLVQYRMELMPEISGKLERALDACVSPKTAPVFLDGAQPVDAATLEDDRSAAQKRHDAFAALVDAASRSAELPTIGGAAPTVLVRVDAKELRSGSGAGWIDGVEQPISMGAINQLACAGGIQRVVFDELGAVVALGTPERIFNAQQRRAISARDGGCVIPGCRVPAGWCEIHHVREWSKGGVTNTDNGVLLCWFHHRTIDSSGWAVTMRRGVPHVRAPGWIDRAATDTRAEPA